MRPRSFKNVRVGLDCANGSSYSVAKGVFDALGAKTYAIGMEPNGININDGCGSTHIENLQKFVKENNLDVGFAYDGDADRCLAVDDRGEVIDGDAILYLCGCYLKEKGELNNNTNCYNCYVKPQDFTRLLKEPASHMSRRQLEINMSMRT